MLGNALRRIRLDQGRTLADVARAARVSMPYLSELERGRKEASSEVLAAVCDALRVDLPDLLAEVAGAARELADGQASRAQVIRLDRADGRLDRPADGQAITSRPADGQAITSPPDSSGAVCLLAA
jgi:transcriptional regulator with XRE-family HTH domain